MIEHNKDDLRTDIEIDRMPFFIFLEETEKKKDCLTDALCSYFSVNDKELTGQFAGDKYNTYKAVFDAYWGIRLRKYQNK